MPIYYVDGEFVDAKKAVIPVDDLSVLRGYGVSDVMKTCQGKPYFLDEHVARLVDSASCIGLNLPWNQQAIQKIILQTLEKNQTESSGSSFREATIRSLITGGTSPDFLHPADSPRLIVMVTPQPSLPEYWYTKGVKVITEFQERTLPKAKSTSYIPAALALKRAREQDAMEAIYIDRNNNALEATTSNLFAFFKDTLATPAQGILHGITRNLVLSLAKEKEDFSVEERNISLPELLTAQEVFITGTNKGIVPVVQIDKTLIGSGQPGPHTQTLMAAIKNHAQNFQKNKS